MNKKIIIGLIAVSIVAILALFWSSNKKAAAPEDNLPTTIKTEEQTTNQKTIKELMTENQTVSCVFTDETSGTNSKGTFFVTSGKLRGDFTYTSGTSTLASHMIIKDNTGYLWMDGQTTGFTMAVTDNAAGTPNNQGVDPSKPLNMKCEPWKVDNTKFDLPSSITFSNSLSNLPSGNTQINTQTKPASPAAAQGICESLPEPARTECLKNIK